MEQEEELLYTIALKKCPGISDRSIKKLLHHFQSAKNIWENISDLNIAEIQNIYAHHIKEIGNKTYLEFAKTELSFMQKHEIKYVLLNDVDYPKFLKEIPDSPVVLFYMGDIKSLNNNNLSIVGTRNINEYGKRILTDFFDGIHNLNLNIVSGLALGVDTEAHLLSLKKELPTTAVLAHGLHMIYPKNNEKLARQIIEKGCLITEFLVQDNILPEYFIRRNRIIAGLSKMTLIIESAIKGGAMSTANFAFNYDRDVFAAPGKIFDKFSQGCNMLINSQKAQIYTCPNDIIQAMGLNDKKKSKPVQKEIFIELNKEEQKIIDLLKQKGKLQIDQMAYELNEPTFVLMPTLLEMEFKEVIKSYPGKFFDLE